MTTSPDVVRRLAELGTGFSWHARVHDLRAEDVARARSLVAARAAEVRESPLVPESALAIVARAAADLPRGARVVALDGEPALVDALRARGLDVVALAERIQVSAYAEAGVDARAFSVADPVAEDLVACAQLVVVDAFRRDGRLVPLLSRAVAMASTRGLVSLVSHALTRDLVKTALALVPVRVVAHDDELVARLVTGAHLADIFWDHVLLETDGRAPPIAASQGLSERALDDHDPEHERHGCVEVHDLTAPFTHGGVEAVFARFEALTGLRRLAETVSVVGTVAHHHAVFDDGSSAVSILDDERGVFRCDFTPWTPALHVDVTAAVLTSLPRGQGAIVFSSKAPSAMGAAR